MFSVVFIDSRVQDYEHMLAGLAADVQVVFLDPFQDGITQIAAVTAALTHLDSIRTNSHGSSGTLYLGSTVLTEENIDDDETQLSRIGASHSDAGDLLLYDCDVGAGATGRSFIARLGDFHARMWRPSLKRVRARIRLF